jgi:Xaa-Pro aminopeptidase
VAAGDNATILHYVENRARIADGDLVLVDAGCEYEGYASDVTRTCPASGRFTPLQRRAYEIVLDAQHAAIAAVRPGARVDDVHEAAGERLLDGLIELKLLTGTRAALARRHAAHRFTLHRTSHWLGRDVHDRGRYTEGGSSRRLAPGMVLTVEPGLYVRRDERRAPPELLGLGIRIEDDVLVTDDAPRVLSSDAPKTVEELEAAVGRSSTSPSS